MDKHFPYILRDLKAIETAMSYSPLLHLYCSGRVWKLQSLYNNKSEMELVWSVIGSLSKCIGDDTPHWWNSFNRNPANAIPHKRTGRKLTAPRIQGILYFTVTHEGLKSVYSSFTYSFYLYSVKTAIFKNSTLLMSC